MPGECSRSLQRGARCAPERPAARRRRALFRLRPPLRSQGRERGSARAAGAANGRNPISIIIPCHRVAGSDGSLTGYAGGVGRKLWLLEHEGVDASRLRVPRRGTAL